MTFENVFPEACRSHSPCGLQSTLRCADQWDVPSSFLWLTLLPGPSGVQLQQRTLRADQRLLCPLAKGSVRVPTASTQEPAEDGVRTACFGKCSLRGKDGVGKEEWGELSSGRSADGQKLQGRRWRRQSRGNTHRPGRRWAAGWSTGEMGGEGSLPGRWLELRWMGALPDKKGRRRGATNLDEPSRRWPSCHRSILTRVKNSYHLWERHSQG